MMEQELPENHEVQAAQPTPQPENATIEEFIGNGVRAEHPAGDPAMEADAGSPEPPETPAAVADILVAQSEYDAVRQERDALQDQLLRARAEFDNYRKRMAREMDRVRKTAAENVFKSLLPVLDNFERALSHATDQDNGFVQGIEMVKRQLEGVLESGGVAPVPAVGERFDPAVHEAMAHQPSDAHPADYVTEEYERGYRLGDYILRPARVVVSSGMPASDGPSQQMSPDPPDLADQSKQS